MANDVLIVVGAKDAASKVLKDVQGNTDSMASHILSAGKKVTLALGAAGVAGAVGALAGGFATLKSGLDINSEMEQVRASLNAFTKDGAKSEQILQQIRDEAAKTPFAFGEMAKATAALMPVAKTSGAALMDLVKQAEILAASNPMQGLEGASFALREAMTGDFTSIIERFNLSRKTLNELKEQGVPALKAVQIAMQEMGFDADLVANMANTMSGRWSTFMDTIDGIKQKLSENLFKVLSNSLVEVQKFFDENQDAINAWAENAGQKIGEFAQFIITNIPKVVAVFNEIITVVKDISQLDNAISKLLGLNPDDYGNAWEAFGAQFQTIVERLTPIIQEFGQKVLDWVIEQAPIIGAKLLEWGKAFIEWVGPQIPPLLEELGKLYLALQEWAYGTALPAIVSQLAEWGKAFIEWIVPRIPGMLAALAELLGQLGDWMKATALPAIDAQLQEWGDAFLNWIATDVLPELPGKLAEILIAIAKWQVQAEIDIAKQLVGLGKQMVQGLIDGIKSMGSTLWNEVTAFITANVPEPVRRALDMHSPSKVFYKMGQQTVQGYIDGVKQMAPQLDSVFDVVINRFIEIAQAAGRSTDAIGHFVGQLAKYRGNASQFADIMRTANDALNLDMGTWDSALPIRDLNDIAPEFLGKVYSVFDKFGNFLPEKRAAANSPLPSVLGNSPDFTRWVPGMPRTADDMSPAEYVQKFGNVLATIVTPAIKGVTSAYGAMASVQKTATESITKSTDALKAQAAAMSRVASLVGGGGTSRYGNIFSPGDRYTGPGGAFSPSFNDLWNQNAAAGLSPFTDANGRVSWLTPDQMSARVASENAGRSGATVHPGGIVINISGGEQNAVLIQVQQALERVLGPDAYAAGVVVR